MQAARGVEQQHVDVLQLRRFERAARDIHRLLALHDRQGGDLDLRAEHRELFLRRGPRHVERRHQRLLAVLLADILGELGGGRRLARALQADHHHHDRRPGIEVQIFRNRAVAAAEHLDQLVMDDLDDLLSGGDRAQHIVPDRLFGHGIDEPPRHGKRDVCFEQRDAHLAHRLAHVRLAQRAATAQAVEHVTEAVGQIVEHALPQNRQ